jgi:hypothetical protein
MLSCGLHFEGERAVSTVVADTDAALAFSTVALIVVSLIVLVMAVTLFRRIRDAVVKWYYRRKYAAEFRRKDQR